MKFGVITFPGSNCDYDAYTAVKVIGEDSEFLWHQSTDLANCDVIILPGGFAHGDYLRSGAIARFSPIMKSVKEFASGGGLVIGICNGFQVLLESGLLPGALIRNKHLRFSGKDTYIRVERNDTPFTCDCNIGDVLKIPIAHKDGNYYNFDDELGQLKDSNQVVFRYCDETGNFTDESNPNGSADNIAGIISAEGNVMGMMPHPERAMENILGSSDGIKVFESIKNFINRGVACEKA